MRTCVEDEVLFIMNRKSVVDWRGEGERRSEVAMDGWERWFLEGDQGNGRKGRRRKNNKLKRGFYCGENVK